eukprot:m.481591 g.481591  ORF g.481591 m.481591 type:complete len:365 (+) comp22238_c0_seq1:258-1352(+)
MAREESLGERVVHAVGTAVRYLRHTFNVVAAIVGLLLGAAMLIVLTIGASLGATGDTAGWLLAGAGTAVLAVCAILLYFFWKDVDGQFSVLQLLELSREELLDHFLKKMREELGYSEPQPASLAQAGAGTAQQLPYQPPQQPQQAGGADASFPGGAMPQQQQYPGYQPPHFQHQARAMPGSPQGAYGGQPAGQQPHAMPPPQMQQPNTQSPGMFVLPDVVAGLHVPQWGSITPGQLQAYVERWIAEHLAALPDAFVRNLLYSLVGIPTIIFVAGIAFLIVGNQDDNEVNGDDLEPLKWLGVAFIVLGVGGAVLGICAYFALKWSVGTMLSTLTEDAAQSIRGWIMAEIQEAAPPPSREQQQSTT